MSGPRLCQGAAVGLLLSVAIHPDPVLGWWQQLLGAAALLAAAGVWSHRRRRE